MIKLLHLSAAVIVLHISKFSVLLELSVVHKKNIYANSSVYIFWFASQCNP